MPGCPDVAVALVAAVVLGSAASQAGSQADTSVGTRAATHLVAATAPVDSSPPGRLEILEMQSSVFNNTRQLRVWLPIGYDDAENRGRSYPVLYLNDGQNLFASSTARSGSSGWQVDEVAANLQRAGRIQPIVVVGIDNAGRSGRAREYLPYPDEFLRPPEPDPQGGLYPDFLAEDVIPFVERRFRVERGREGRTLGGSSYGALAALYVAISRPDLFSSLLLESPSLYVDDNHILRAAAAADLDLDRVYLGVGTNELGLPGCPDHAGNAEAVDGVRQLADILHRTGLREGKQTRVIVEECAVHNEAAWAGRLPSALEFLFQTPSNPSGADVEIERLVGLARVWGQVKYFHPTLAHRSDIDWDSTLVAAIPRVRAAHTSLEYAAAVQAMLAAVEDPLTRVLALETGKRVARPDREFGYRSTDDGVLIITAGNYGALFAPSVPQVVAGMQSAYGNATAVVVDLRSGRPTHTYARLQLTSALGGLERLFTVEPLDTPGEWYRVYAGFESDGQFSSGQYTTGVFIRGGRRVGPTSGSRGIPIVFVLNEHSGILPTTLPLRAAGRARIVFEGDATRHTIGETVEIGLPDGVRVQVRSSESVLADGTSAIFRPDEIVPAPALEDGDPALDRAIRMAREFEPSPLVPGRLPAVVTQRPDRSYPEMRYPSAEYRILAAFRIWNTILHFYPYRELLDHDWEAVLGERLPSFIDARNAGEYARAVAVMVERIQDSHAYLAGTLVTEEVVATGFPSIRVRMIEDTPVVTRVGRGARDGIAVGDVVVSVDGEPAADRLAATARLIAASTPWNRMDRAALSFMNGPPGSRVTLTLRDAADRQRDVVLERQHEDFTTLYHRERDGEVMRILPGNIGYIDLDRLALADVDRMFERMAGTAGIIFDMRGYPQGTIWRIAPWLAREAVVAARFATPLVGYPAPEPASLAFVQTVEPAVPGEVGYRGPTVLLIDERTMSQAEHAGLYLKAANGTLFVGSPTAGANGEITTFSLPGGITVGFTGQAVTHPDGRQLQRIGLRPDIEIRPTIGGIRAGVDEVLDEALRQLVGVEDIL